MHERIWIPLRLLPKRSANLRLQPFNLQNIKGLPYAEHPCAKSQAVSFPVPALSGKYILSSLDRIHRHRLFSGDLSPVIGCLDLPQLEARSRPAFRRESAPFRWVVTLPLPSPDLHQRLRPEAENSSAHGLTKSNKGQCHFFGLRRNWDHPFYKIHVWEPRKPCPCGFPANPSKKGFPKQAEPRPTTKHIEKKKPPAERSSEARIESEPSETKSAEPPVGGTRRPPKLPGRAPARPKS